jgi:sigma-B regulation protein RsbU (phosphoserine phosphatase)
MLVRANGQLESLVPSGPPLGVVPDAEYPQHITTFDVFDTLVVFSDGLTEARSADGTLFGEEAVAEGVQAGWELEPDELSTALVRRAEAHAGGRLSDDLTVIVIRYAGERPVGPLGYSYEI